MPERNYIILWLTFECCSHSFANIVLTKTLVEMYYCWNAFVWDGGIYIGNYGLEFWKCGIKDCEWFEIRQKCGIKNWELWSWFRKCGIKHCKFWSKSRSLVLHKILNLGYVTFLKITLQKKREFLKPLKPVIFNENSPLIDTLDF